MWDLLLEWDQKILIFFNNLGADPYDTFWQTVTKYPPWIPLFLLFLTLILKSRPWREALGLLFVLGIMVLFVETFSNLTKLFFERLRPNNDEAIKSLIRVLANPSSYSFFSGHAAMSFSVTTFLYFSLRQRFRWIWICYIWPLFFIASRIYLGVHYPSDILVGALFGLLSAWIFQALHSNLILPYLKSNRP